MALTVVGISFVLFGGFTPVVRVGIGGKVRRALAERGGRDAEAPVEWARFSVTHVGRMAVRLAWLTTNETPIRESNIVGDCHCDREFKP